MVANNDELDIIKIDLDIKWKYNAIRHLRKKLKFMVRIKIIKWQDINKIVLIKKSKYSVKIYFAKPFKSAEYLILFQAVMGDDWKRTLISLRDFYIGIEDWNRLFNYKKYIKKKMLFNNKKKYYWRMAKVIDVTKIIKPINI